MSRLCVILFGPPGSGKGTQAKLLNASLGLAHISTGDMLREKIAAADGLGAEVAAIMKTGKLVPDNLVNQMVEEKIDSKESIRGFILDGYPRTVAQAELLDGLIKARPVCPVVVYLKVDYNVIIGRIAGRRQCPNCNALYGLTSKNPVVAGICDNCGSKLVIREDDREEVVRERLKAYDGETRPVLEYFKQAGYPELDIDGGSEPPQAIAEDIVKWIRSVEQTMAARRALEA